MSSEVGAIHCYGWNSNKKFGRNMVFYISEEMGMLQKDNSEANYPLNR